MLIFVYYFGDLIGDLTGTLSGTLLLILESVRANNVTINPSEIFSKRGAGKPYSLQLETMRLIPEPYFSIIPSSLKKSAISLFLGTDL